VTIPAPGSFGRLVVARVREDALEVEYVRRAHVLAQPVRQILDRGRLEDRVDQRRGLCGGSSVGGAPTCSSSQSGSSAGTGGLSSSAGVSSASSSST